MTWLTGPVMAAILSKVLGTLLTQFFQRQDVEDAAKYRVLQNMQPAIRAGAEWNEVAWRDPARAAVLGVLPGATGLRPGGPDDPPLGGPV